MKKAAIVACSNAQQLKYRTQIGELITFLQSIGIETELSECIYSDDSAFSGTPRERGTQLMKMFRIPEIEEIYDISGGDVSNQILDELDYKVIADSKAIFWGYSDLSTVINAIYTMTGKESVLYQVKNMVRGDNTAIQRERFRNRKELFEPSFTFIQKSAMKGVVVGGNIRCFLKLAGTRYFPDLQDKILGVQKSEWRTSRDFYGNGAEALLAGHHHTCKRDLWPGNACRENSRDRTRRRFESHCNRAGDRAGWIRRPLG